MVVSVGAIGMGLMGSAIARRLLEMDHEVSVWNRTAAKCEPLGRAGAHIAADPQALIARSEVVIAITSTTSDVEPILTAAGARLAGKDVLNLVTGTPAQVRTMAAVVRGAGASFLSGTIQAYPSGIGHEAAAIVCGGEPAAWTRLEPLIKGLAGGSYFAGEDPGRPNVVDSAVTGCFLFGAMGACLEAANYAAKEGLSVSEFRALAQTYAKILPSQVDSLLGAIEAGDYSTDATLTTFANAMELFRSAFADVEAADRLLTANLQSMRQAIERGAGEQSFAALYRFT